MLDELLRLLADTLGYGEIVRGIFKLSEEQIYTLYETMKLELNRLGKGEILKSQPVIENRQRPVRELSVCCDDKPHSSIDCCLHCGSVAIKKMGKTRAGMQRYKCRDCGKTFSENYGLITHYTHLSTTDWLEVIRGTISGLSITDIAKITKHSTKTIWLCRMKIYQTIQNVFDNNDVFNSITEVDGKYERISFKGCRDKSFFIDKLGRLPRHHRSRQERKEYLIQCGKYKELFEQRPSILKEMIFAKQKRMSGRDTIDVSHQHLCIITMIDRDNSIFIKALTSGTPTAIDVNNVLCNEISDDAVLVTDEHLSYRFFVHKNNIDHVIIPTGVHKIKSYSLARVNSLHSSLERFLGSKECKPATKYLDLYLKMFWWLEKNKDISKLELMNRLKDILYGTVCSEYRAKMTKVTQKELYDRPLPIDTKGYY